MSKNSVYLRQNDAGESISKSQPASEPVASDSKQHKIISVRQAAEIIENADDSVLILDCRSFMEYNVSHVKKAINICCSKLMKRRLQQDKVLPPII